VDSAAELSDAVARIGGMTMTVSASHGFGLPWTVDDLKHTPEDGNRYEIADGRLIVTPPPHGPHIRVNTLVRRVLDRAAPESVVVLDCSAGIDIRRRTTCYIPDVMVVHAAAFRRVVDVFEPADVLLVVEVLSPGNAGFDVVQKRHDYAAAGIPRYWIVDPRDRTVTVLALADGATAYAEEAVVRDVWETDFPYPLTVDVKEIF
jgi:Uma2 family endonuclease